MLSIDITDTGVRIVQAKRSGKKIRVQKAAKCLITPGIVENGIILDLFMLAGEITELLTANQFAFQETIISINSGTILYKEIVLPKPKQISPMLVENLIANDMGLSDAYNITYSIVDELTQGKAKFIKVVAGAIPQDIVDKYIELGRQLGLKLHSVVIGVEGVSRIMSTLPTKEEKSPLLLLQVDRRYININIYEQNKLVSSRYVMVDPADYEGNPDCINLCIFDNVFRIIHFFNSSPESEPIKHLSYYGEFDDEDALLSTLKQFNLPLDKFQKPSNVIAPSSFEFSQYLGNVAALYKTNKVESDINLLESRAVRIKRSTNQFLRLVSVGALVLISITAGLTAYTGLLVQEKERELSYVQADYERLDYDNVIARVQAKKDAIAAFQTYVEQVERADAIVDFQYNMTPDILAKIQSVMLPDMHIEGDISVGGGNVSVSFVCDEPTTPAQYTELLISQGYFEKINYTGYSTTDSDQLRFSLTMSLRGGNGFEA